MVQEKIMSHTYSVCPICLKRIPAQRVGVDEKVYLKKECPTHGKVSTIIWRGKREFNDWMQDAKPIADGENENCPTACGLCSEHKQGTCCTLLEITSRCNLSCRFCFADNKHLADPSFEQVYSWLTQLVQPCKTLLQLSGGEPTVRDDLPQIIAVAKEVGCKYVQLNSNGLRLAEDKEFVKALAEAGLSFVFMQFDGTEDNIYEILRGKPLFEIKKQAIANCAEYNIGVTLVPTLVPGVNTNNIGDILRFAVENSPAVRGVHFQPVSYFGRVPDLPHNEQRFTLDQLLWQIKEQAGELLQLENLVPSRCDHPLCGFHGDFIVMPKELVPLTQRKKNLQACCCEPVSAEKNREFVARRWQRQQREQERGVQLQGQHQPQQLKEQHQSQLQQEVQLQGQHQSQLQQESQLKLQKQTASCSESESEHKHKHQHKQDTNCNTVPDIHSLNGFLQRVSSHGFTVTAMAFQDAGNLDLERLRNCSLHVFDKGRLIPFCSYYLSSWAQS